ncbi:hypothetical protein OF83DRAFT_686762 [Amylostereum chailletii]|nr:hypothetical protein OF83DRAFT_686762 [Amylostereum chailletii]
MPSQAHDRIFDRVYVTRPPLSPPLTAPRTDSTADMTAEEIMAKLALGGDVLECLARPLSARDRAEELYVARHASTIAPSASASSTLTRTPHALRAPQDRVGAASAVRSQARPSAAHAHRGDGAHDGAPDPVLHQVRRARGVHALLQVQDRALLHQALPKSRLASSQALLPTHNPEESRAREQDPRPRLARDVHPAHPTNPRLPRLPQTCPRPPQRPLALQPRRRRRPPHLGPRPRLLPRRIPRRRRRRPPLRPGRRRRRQRGRPSSVDGAARLRRRRPPARPPRLHPHRPRQPRPRGRDAHRTRAGRPPRRPRLPRRAPRAVRPAEDPRELLPVHARDGRLPPRARGGVRARGLAVRHAQGRRGGADGGGDHDSDDQRGYRAGHGQRMAVAYGLCLFVAFACPYYALTEVCMYAHSIPAKRWKGDGRWCMYARLVLRTYLRLEPTPGSPGGI